MPRRILLENLRTFALVCIFSRICFSMRPIDIRAPDEARRIVAATISVFDTYLNWNVVPLPQGGFAEMIKFAINILNEN